MAPSNAAPTRPVAETLTEYGRGLAGGLLFSLPLLYTMEVWWQGHLAPPGRQLAYVVGMFGLLVAYTHVVGLRQDRSLQENLHEALEAVALGLFAAAVVLTLAGRLSLEGISAVTLGKLTMEGMVTAIGVAVGTTQLGASEGEQDSGEERDEPEPRGLLAEVAFALLGAVLVASNVAPTEEILLIAVETHTVSLLLIVVLSLGFALGMVRYAGFRGAGRLEDDPLAGHPLWGSVVTYAAALAASAAMLWAFGRFDGAGWSEVVRQIVVLGLPAVLGAAAGRLLLGGEPS
ncbi:MAG: TIGR02587 family membrane protein [Rhodothermales bacterium]